MTRNLVLDYVSGKKANLLRFYNSHKIYKSFLRKKDSLSILISFKKIKVYSFGNLFLKFFIFIYFASLIYVVRSRKNVNWISCCWFVGLNILSIDLHAFKNHLIQIINRETTVKLVITNSYSFNYSKQTKIKSK